MNGEELQGTWAEEEKQARVALQAARRCRQRAARGRMDALVGQLTLQLNDVTQRLGRLEGSSGLGSSVSDGEPCGSGGSNAEGSRHVDQPGDAPEPLEKLPLEEVLREQGDLMIVMQQRQKEQRAKQEDGLAALRDEMVALREFAEKVKLDHDERLTMAERMLQSFPGMRCRVTQMEIKLTDDVSKLSEELSKVRTRCFGDVTEKVATALTEKFGFQEQRIVELVEAQKAAGCGRDALRLELREAWNDIGALRDEVRGLGFAVGELADGRGGAQHGARGEVAELSELGQSLAALESRVRLAEDEGDDIRERVAELEIELEVGHPNGAGLSSPSEQRRQRPRQAAPGYWRPGDWCCPRCQDVQFARRLECRRCGTRRPSDGSGSGSECELDHHGGCGGPRRSWAAWSARP